MTRDEFQKRFTYNPNTDRLGEGGFGEVFKTYDTVRDRWVAMKVSKVRPELENVRLRKEVEMVNHLPEHPNIAFYEACYTFREMSGEYDFGILQYYEEGNLSQLLKNNSLSLSPKQSLLSQILEGLDFLHAQGIIHRDLKPQNILMVRRQNGEYIPKITDFGISKQLDINKSSVFSNSLAGAGTLTYASPEQLGAREIRKNTDLWSFGVIAFQTFTGQLPFTTGEHASTSEAGRTELFRQINSGRLPEIINSIPEPWQTLIRRCLVTDPAQRLKNTQEAKNILAGNGRDVARNVSTETEYETKIDQPPSKPSEPLKPSDPLPPRPTTPINKKYLLFAAIAAAIVLLLIFGWQAFNRNSESGKNNSTANDMEQKQAPAIPASINDNAIDMVFVQGGTFTMGCTPEQGSDCYSDEKPAHQVTVSSFYIGKYEVTQEQWKMIMGSNPSNFKGDNLPVESVSWYDVQEFIRKLNAQTGKQYRLPTEAEWEFACRGGLQSAHYKYSGSNNLNDIAWYSDNSGKTTHPVGTKSPNELGIYDMNGNVWEWCDDWYGAYSSGAQTNPQGTASGSYRVFRGGSCYCIARYARVSNRFNSTPDFRNYNLLGFRLACSSN